LRIARSKLKVPAGMDSMRPLAVLFDMDGVLVRSDEIWFRVVEEAGLRFRGRAITREEFFPTFGQGTQADVEVFGLRCSAEQLDRFYIENFGRYASGVWVDPQAATVLAALRRAGKKLAVVTNTVSPLAREILDASHLTGYFDAIACADHVERAKPAPDLVHHALDMLRLGADDAVYIGDSRFDRDAARDAGVHFIGLRLDGDRRIEALSELTGALRSS
jgi:HAD superfamily hydrolase (TIGR01509 family)